MRKTIAMLAALLCIAGLAHAETVASMPNDAGGRIDITDIPAPDGYAPCKNRALAKSWGNGEDRYGCWAFNEDTVVILWLGGAAGDIHRTYRAKSFTLTPYGETLRGKANAAARAKAPA